MSSTKQKNRAKEKKSREEEVNDKFVDVINKRAGGGVLGLNRNFHIIDSDGSGRLSYSEFRTALKKFRIGLSAEESKILFAFYDKDSSGEVSFNEFLHGIRSKLSPQRRSLVEQAFDVLDTDGSGELTFEDLKDKYKTKNHPDVLSRQKTQKQVVEEFLQLFEGEGGNHDGVITKEEWLDYHVGLSANYDTDDAFGMMMSNAWPIEYVAQADVSHILDLMRAKCNQRAGSKPARRVARDLFRYFDLDGSKTVGFSEFTRAMESFGLAMKSKELTTLFRSFDRDGSGEIEYDELVDMLFPK